MLVHLKNEGKEFGGILNDTIIVGEKAVIDGMDYKPLACVTKIKSIEQKKCQYVFQYRRTASGFWFQVVDNMVAPKRIREPRGGILYLFMQIDANIMNY